MFITHIEIDYDYKKHQELKNLINSICDENPDIVIKKLQLECVNYLDSTNIYIVIAKNEKDVESVITTMENTNDIISNIQIILYQIYK
jgi:hypothetical protein